MVAAAAELGGDGVDVHLLALGAEADAGQAGFGLLEGAGDDDGFDVADVVDEAFAVAGRGAGAVVVGFFNQK